MLSQIKPNFNVDKKDNTNIFIDSLIYKQHIKKCLYIIYSFQKNTSNHWITRLPPLLLKDILFEFIVDPFTIGRYYSIIDNRNSKFSFDTIEYKLERQRWEERGKYYVGKILDKQIEKNKTLYLVSYKDWPNDFNEWVSQKQLFHMKNNYIHTLKKHKLIDCRCNNDNRWYGGIITKLYYTNNNTKNISHIDVLSFQKNKKNFFYYIKIPIYSKHYAKFRTHVRSSSYHINKSYLLSALRMLDINKLKNSTNYVEFSLSTNVNVNNKVHSICI